MRPDVDSLNLKMAELVALRGTCLRRQVGCVLVNAKGHVLSTGYNGRARGLPHCNEGRTHITYDEPEQGYYPHACKGATSPSGQNLDGCEAIHAEQNALLQCKDVDQIQTAYVTASPCVTCVKLFMNTSCERIVFAAPYAHDKEARDLWLRKQREWVWKKIA